MSFTGLSVAGDSGMVLNMLAANYSTLAAPVLNSFCHCGLGSLGI